MSSPNLNNLIILGCILVYVSGVLFGLNKGVYRTGCQVSENFNTWVSQTRKKAIPPNVEWINGSASYQATDG